MGGLRGLWIALAAVAVMAPCLSNSLIYYDDAFLLSQVPASFSELLSRTLVVGSLLDFYPLRDLSHWLELKLFGDAVFWVKLDNLLLYGLLVWALHRWLRHMAPNEAWPHVAALWFAVLPIHAEAVCWIAARKDLLAALFSVLALSAHLGTARVRRRLGTLWMLCALLSKASAMALPLALSVQVWWRCEPSERWSRLRALWPEWLLGVAFAVLSWRYYAQLGQATVRYARLEIPIAWGRYVAASIWPHALAPIEWERPGSWVAASYVGALLVLAWLGWRTRSLWWLAIAAALFLPNANVIPTAHVYADRYFLLPSFGVVVVLSRTATALHRVVLVVVLIACAAATSLEALKWRDETHFWDAMHERQPTSWMARIGWARAHRAEDWTRALPDEWDPDQNEPRLFALRADLAVTADKLGEAAQWLWRAYQHGLLDYQGQRYLVAVALASGEPTALSWARRVNESLLQRLDHWFELEQQALILARSGDLTAAREAMAELGTETLSERTAEVVIRLGLDARDAAVLPMLERFRAQWPEECRTKELVTMAIRIYGDAVSEQADTSCVRRLGTQ